MEDKAEMVEVVVEVLELLVVEEMGLVVVYH